MIKEGIKHPRKSLEYLILGKERYEILQNLAIHTCTSGITPTNPLESRMIVPTDIHEHLCTLYMLTKELDLKRILELGTRSGESTVAFLQAAREINGHVTSIDIDPCLEAKTLIKNLKLEDRWQFIQDDDLKTKWGHPIDHLFIDTLHTYAQTITELEKFSPLVTVGGIITLHDIIAFPEVLRAIKDFLKKRHDTTFYKFFNNNGLGIIRMGNPKVQK